MGKAKDIQIDDIAAASLLCESPPEPVPLPVLEEDTPAPPIVAEAACEVEADDNCDDDDIALLVSVLDMCERRKLKHRKRLKQMRLFEALWDSAYWAKKFLSQ